MSRNNVNIPEFTNGPNTFTQLYDVKPHTFTGKIGNVFIVDPTETFLEPVSPAVIIPPLIPGVVGAGLQNHIPIWNDPLGIPPVFIDSGVSVVQISLGPITGTVIDFEPVANPQSHLIGVVNNTPGGNLFAMACNSLSTPTADRDLIITNNSVGAQDMLFVNNSGGGIGSNNFIGGAETTTILDSLSSNYIQINPTNISLADTIDNNFININSSGIASVVLGAGQSNVVAADGLAVLQSYNNKAVVQELVSGNFLQCGSNGTSIESGNGNVIDVSSSNNNVTINSNTDIIINTSYKLPTIGNSLNQVAVIDNTNQMSFVDESTLNVPASIPMKRIEGLGQIIAPSTSALMEGGQQYSSGSIPDWTTNNTLGGTVDGLIEANLTFTSQFGTSQNFTMQPLFNGIAYTTGLSQIMNGVSSYSNIYNVAITDTLSFEITNNDAVLNVVISEFILTFKKIQQYNP